MRISAGKSIFWGLGAAMLVAGELLRKARKELTLKNRALEQGLLEKNRELEEANRALQEEVHERKQAEEQLKQTNAQLRQLSARLQSIREEERTRIAREIHDVLGQQLTVLKLDIAWLHKRLPGEAFTERTAVLLSAVDETLQSVRKLATELRPGVLDDLGLIAAIEWQCREFEARTGIRCSMHTHIHDLACTHEISTAVFRIFQETLTNIMRHARASAIRISISIDDDILVLKVNDNGRGITQEEISNSRSLGLLGMRERISGVGGELRISGEPGRGTMVKLTIPLEPKPGANGKC